MFTLLNAVTVQVTRFQLWLHTTRCESVALVALLLLCNVLFGAVVVGIIEELLPLESV